MYAGVLGTLIRYNDNLEKWEVASEASARAEIPASIDSYNLGINDWRITGDKKCHKSLENSYESKVRISATFVFKAEKVLFPEYLIVLYKRYLFNG